MPALNLQKLSGAAIGTSTSWSANSTIQQVFDGDLTTYFDAPNNSLTNWAGLDFLVPQAIKQIKFAPRSGFEYRMVGGQFQASNTADFSSGVVTLYTITTAPVAGQLTSVSVNPAANYRYVRYVGGTEWVNIAEMEIDGVPTAPTATKLTGTVIGTAASWSPTSSINQVFDGNFNTFFDPANGSMTNWVGLDLGSKQIVTQIKYAPRAGYEFRMVGGQFQLSSLADFSSDVVTLYTITTAPMAGQFTSITVSAPAAYRYVRYVGGNQWVNIAEMEVDGYTPAPVAAKLTGTAIGTAASWSPTSSINQVFDGDFTTFFDPATGSLSNWVGLDMGGPQTITQIKYAPRAGYEFRMVGGQFQVSTTADFSSNVVTIYTISSAPIAGQFTTVTVSVPGQYQFIRYIGGNQWVNIAEMEVDGYSS